MAGFARVSTAHSREDFVHQLIDSILEIFIIVNVDGVRLFLNVGVIFGILGHEENGNPALERFSVLCKGTDESNGAVRNDAHFTLDHYVVKFDLALRSLERVDLAYRWRNYDLDCSCRRDGIVGFESDLHKGLRQRLIRALDNRRCRLINFAKLIVLDTHDSFARPWIIGSNFEVTIQNDDLREIFGRSQSGGILNVVKV